MALAWADGLIVVGVEAPEWCAASVEGGAGGAPLVPDVLDVVPSAARVVAVRPFVAPP